MSPLNLQPYFVNIPQSELDLLHQKLELTRLPNSLASSAWGENNGVTLNFMRETIDYWLNNYSWASEQHKINQLPQFTVQIELEHWGTFDVHFVHKRSKHASGKNIPLLFLHGWPGNFTEVARILDPLTEAGYSVVAPSLPGYGFSSYTDKPGFKNWHTAGLMKRLMAGLWYDQFVVVGGDWGAMIASSMARLYPDNVRAMHLTNVFVSPPADKDILTYTPFEQHSLERIGWFAASQGAYGQVQKTKPRTIGLAMHDSPAGMLAWMADKLLLWADEYPWTKDEIITWTLLHYFPGPTTAFQMYAENLPVFEADELPPGAERYVKVPTGVSAFREEVFMVPRAWAEQDFNVVDWQEQPKGGHFPAYERPKELVSDIDSFVKAYWSAEAKHIH